MIKSHKLVEEYRKTFGRYTYDQRDCIGSIWKILEKHGAKTQLVGSNWFARHELRNLRPLTDKSQLYDGCAVLKTVLPGQNGYALPDRYIGHVDQIDYNHIGVGTDDGRIMDSTRYGKKPDGSWTRNGPGWSTAPISPNSWDIIAEFEDVDYSDRGQSPIISTEATIMGKAIVTASSGNTVRLRKSPSTAAAVLANVPVDTEVGLISQEGAWWQVSYRDSIGWMMQEFLTPALSYPVDLTIAPGSMVLLPRALVEDLARVTASIVAAMGDA